MYWILFVQKNKRNYTNSAWKIVSLFHLIYRRTGISSFCTQKSHSLPVFSSWLQALNQPTLLKSSEDVLKYLTLSFFQLSAAFLTLLSICFPWLPSASTLSSSLCLLLLYLSLLALLSRERFWLQWGWFLLKKYFKKYIPYQRIVEGIRGAKAPF